MAEKAILFGYRMSSCSWRVRAALLAKRVPFEERSVDIWRAHEQLTDEYRAINPAQKVPALRIGGATAQRARRSLPGPLVKDKKAGVGKDKKDEKAILFGYRVSSCSWRVRAALLAKRVPFEERCVDIRRAHEQLTDEYRAINPAQKVPALRIDGVTLVESMAILQYLEDTRPEPALTPKSPLDKARMIEICQTIVSGIQPLQNIGLKRYFNDDDIFTKFSLHWTERGLETLEELLCRTAGSCCLGDQLTFADLCLVPQLFNATSRYKMDLSKYPTVTKLYSQLLAQDVIKRSHPDTVKAKA